MYFINCGNRDHERLFGTGAFFDLGTNGTQAAMAQNLRPGDTCIVARYANKARTVVYLQRYNFTHETKQTDDKGIPQRVLHGTLQGAESLSKSDAAADARYQYMFAKNGAFKRRSVLQRTGAFGL
ncbi:MAG TPA: hypothetical protein VGD30_10060 [Telluria sp.]